MKRSLRVWGLKAKVVAPGKLQSGCRHHLLTAEAAASAMAVDLRA
jgi:hypothetical protein